MGFYINGSKYSIKKEVKLVDSVLVWNNELGGAD